MRRTARSRAPHSGSETNLVISLDIGTSCSGASWVFLSPGEDPVIWDVEEFGRANPVSKVPTVLYYDREGILQIAGSGTLNKWTIEEALDQKWTRVEWLKLLLRPSSLAHKAPYTEMPPNKTLDTIMADFLRYMVDLVYKHFRETMDVDEKTWEGVKNRITYILNYSNGWNTFQHFLMRNAAILAEIVPSSDEAKRRIKFVSEGEASLHWCIKNRVGLRKLSVGNQFIVVDAGGGTIDISSFKCVGTDHLEFEESSIPECHLQGSAFVTQAFREYVQAKLEGSSFGTPETIDRIVGNFEQQAMRTFKDRNEDMIVQFGRYQDNDPGFGINAGQLLVPGKEMAQCFELACNAIVASVKAKVVPDCKAILVLVGGFSRNEYLFKEVRSRLHELDIQMFRPIEAKVKPSAHGALCFYLDPAVRSSNMQPADGSDTLVSESDMGSSDPASVGPRPCERNSKGLQHLNYWRSPYKGTENNLAVSIDLGTTFSGTSWVFLEPGQIPQTIWDVPPSAAGDNILHGTKVPSVLFYDRNGNLQAAGGETLEERKIVEAVDQQWTRVEWFKLLLRPQSPAHIPDTTPKTEMPRNKKPVDVIADFLRYMAKLALDHFHEAMDDCGDIWKQVKDRVTYILSHPNGWNLFQHPIMREAAILAELVPDSEEGKNRVIFVSEGEASLHWCMSNRIGRRDLNVNNRFILVDAGGGTIDISSFKTVGTMPLEFEESSVPECHLEGSAFVTQAFRRYVEAKLKGSSFGHLSMIQRIVDHFDQYTKRNFKDPEEDMPVRFGRDEDNDPRFGIEAGRIVVNGKTMASFYENACRAIVASVKNKIVRDRKTTVVLVGGFAGSKYLFTQVKSRLEGPHIQVLRPNEATAKASASGVICYYLDRSVSARMAKWTYGISCVHDFDPKDPKHIQRKSRVQKNPVSGQKFIDGGFLFPLTKGTVVHETKLTRFPIWHSQPTRTSTILEIVLESYRGDIPDIKFRDEDREDQFQKLCSFKLAIPDISLIRKTRNKVSRKKHYYVSNFHVVVSFGATEFKCYTEWTDKRGKTQRGSVTPIWNEC